MKFDEFLRNIEYYKKVTPDCLCPEKCKESFYLVSLKDKIAEGPMCKRQTERYFKNSYDVTISGSILSLDLIQALIIHES